MGLIKDVVDGGGNDHGIAKCDTVQKSSRRLSEPNKNWLIVFW